MSRSSQQAVRNPVLEFTNERLSVAFARCRGLSILMRVSIAVYLISCGCSRRTVIDPGVTANVSPAVSSVSDISAEPDVSDVAEIASVHVRSGEDIQEALDKAAENPAVNEVIVHAGTYRPPTPRQALIWFNKRHNGIHLRAEGIVTLTAANPSVAKRSAASFPAIVNHVVYFGDGIGPETRLEGFRITGANNFVTTKGPKIELANDPRLQRTGYFYFDGGGIKIFGRSYPTLESLEIFDNYASPCGAGISIEHRGFVEQQVTIKHCKFRGNRAPLTGAALDLLGHDKGSAAFVENCLFIDNASNCSMDDRSLRLGTWKPKVGHGAITVFDPCTLKVRNCTLVGNRNGVDDRSPTSTYESCIFWNNSAVGGWPTGPRYEIDIANPAGVSNCFVGGRDGDRRSNIDPKNNVLDAPDPQFNDAFVPQSAIYETTGYRPQEQRRAAPDHRETTTAASTNEPLLVRARGSDFNWYFFYAGKDGIHNTDDDIRTRRHLYLPVGRQVRIQLESDDFLYSLKLPHQGANEIAVPGLVHYCDVMETQAGSYPLKGDQFCGYAHPDLIGRVIFQPASQHIDSLFLNQIQ